MNTTQCLHLLSIQCFLVFLNYYYALAPFAVALRPLPSFAGHTDSAVGVCGTLRRPKHRSGLYLEGVTICVSLSLYRSKRKGKELSL